MQGIVGGSWRPCTALLHQSGFCVAKGLRFVRLSSCPDLHRCWYRSRDVFMSVREHVVWSTISARHRCGMWGQTDMNKLGVGFEAWRERVPRRESLSTVVAARRSVLHSCRTSEKMKQIIRPKSVRVEAQDMKGKKFAMTLKEWQARIFQHEYDHLEGTLYFDRMSPEVLDSIQPDLKKLEELYEQRTGLPAPEKISNKK